MQITRKMTVLLLVLALALLGLSACGSREEESEVPVDEPEESSQSEPAPAPSPSSEPDTSEPEDEDDEEPEPTPAPSEPAPAADVPQTPETGPAVLSGSPMSDVAGDRALPTPQTDSFALSKPLESAQITADTIREIRLGSVPGDSYLSLTSSFDIAKVLDLMAKTEVTSTEADRANPSTGGGLVVAFLFDDGSSATITLANLVWINDAGPFLFVDESAETLYWTLLAEMGG